MSGSAASGSSAVAAMGIASVTHHVTISTASDTTYQASVLSPSGCPVHCKPSASIGPSTRPMR